MEKNDFYNLIESNSLNDISRQDELAGIINQYPYFSVARVLYLHNLSEFNQNLFPQELKKMSVFIPDARKLFTIIEGYKYKIKTEFVEEEKEDSFSLIESFLQNINKGDNSTKENELLLQPSVSSDYIYWSLESSSNDKEKEDNVEDIKLTHQDLIDSFIEEDENRTSRSFIQSSDLKEDQNAPESSIDEKTVKSIDDSYFTETLAHIYVKQKRYEKALQIIKNLSLKYPEKNVYFADQIRFLEKLIINSKK